MVAMETWMLFIAMMVSVILALLVVYSDALCKRARRGRAEEQKEGSGNTQNECPEDSVSSIIPEPSPTEQALLAANHQSLQLNMGALEAHRLLAEAAHRHEHDPMPSSWYVDAEWKV